jgi:hypothetical protein
MAATERLDAGQFECTVAAHRSDMRLLRIHKRRYRLVSAYAPHDVTFD